jgi:hypothetical protein
MEVQLHVFLTSVVGGEWSASHPSCFTHSKNPPVPIGKKTGYAPEVVWMWWQREKIPQLNVLGI